MGFRDDNKIRIVQTKAEKGDGKTIGPNTVEVFSGYGKTRWVKTLIGLKQKFLIEVEGYQKLGELMGTTTGLLVLKGSRQIPNRKAEFWYVFTA